MTRKSLESLALLGEKVNGLEVEFKISLVSEKSMK